MPIPERNWQLPDPENLDATVGFEFNRYYFLCHPFNTYIRYYAAGNGKFDYFAIATQHDPVYFPLHHERFSDVAEKLVLNNFPTYHESEPDDTAYEVYKSFIAQGFGIQSR